MVAFGARPFSVFATAGLPACEHRRGHRPAQIGARIELLPDLAAHAHLHGLDPGQQLQVAFRRGAMSAPRIPTASRSCRDAEKRPERCQPRRS